MSQEKHLHGWYKAWCLCSSQSGSLNVLDLTHENVGLFSQKNSFLEVEMKQQA